jgi:D-alanine-D-alanine ligase
MKVGLTYDLRSEYLKQGYTLEETAEFDREETIVAIESTLNLIGYQTERIGNIKQLAEALVYGKRWDIVFNICEGMYGIGREAQVPALLDAYNVPYVFSGPLVLALTLHKAMTKSVVRDAGVPTPAFHVVHKSEDISAVSLSFPLFAKPLAEGTGKGIDSKSVIYNEAQLRERCLYLLDRFKQPVLIEKYLSGREFTVGIVGTGTDARSVGVMEIILNENAEKNVYSYVNKEECEELVEYVLVKGPVAEACEKVAIDAWRALGCEDAGRVDVRHNENGIPNFIEVNPLAGIHPEHSDLPILSTKNGIRYPELMRMIMDSAIKKIRKTPGRHEESSYSYQQNI